MINPYDLLGVTIDSSLGDVKKAYYKLALLCHEDKGGNKDDMIAVHSAYKFVIREISNINNLTLENIENQFKDFCQMQKDAVPKFQDIYAEAFDLPKFNNYFEKSTVISATLEGGYGDLMEKSEHNNMSIKETEDTDQNDYKKYAQNYNDKEVGIIKNNFENQLGKYSAPTEQFAGFQNSVDYSRETYVDNFSSRTDNGLDMSDYKEAFSLNNKFDKIIEKINEDEEDIEKALDEKMKERCKLELNVKSNRIWSFSEILDGARKSVKNYLKIT